MKSNRRFVSILLLILFTGCFTRAYAQYTSTIHCLFSPAWEGKQVMLVANVLNPITAKVVSKVRGEARASAIPLARTGVDQWLNHAVENQNPHC